MYEFIKVGDKITSSFFTKFHYVVFSLSMYIMELISAQIHACKKSNQAAFPVQSLVSVEETKEDEEIQDTAYNNEATSSAYNRLIYSL